jgi:outer membrane protein assembly factor BamE (lipoprotein component of BamABCDE complex)
MNRFVGLLVVLAILFVGCNNAGSGSSTSGITHEKYAKIQTGMSQQEVTTILGQPMEKQEHGKDSGGLTWRWSDEDNIKQIEVFFDNGKVKGKSYQGPTKK